MSESLSMREYTPEEAYEKGYADGRRDSLRAQEQNESLTLEQIKMRVNKPVWYEDIKNKKYSRWQIIRMVNNNFISLGNEVTVLTQEIGSIYNLYIHEPKGAQDNE